MLPWELLETLFMREYTSSPTKNAMYRLARGPAMETSAGHAALSNAAIIITAKNISRGDIVFPTLH
jgi:hypothetical protein